jgi:hypothetical protein
MKKTTVFITVLLFGLLRLSAQSSMVASGGEAPGSDGIASFTVGEVFYTHKSSAFGSTADGMQQSESQPYCYGAKVSNLVIAGTAVKWYATATGGKALATTTLLKTGTYYYTHTTNNVTSARIPVVVTVTPLARSGKISSPASVCFNGNITFSSAAIVGDAIQWEYTTDTPLSASNTTPPIWTAVPGATGLVYTKTNVINTPRSKFYIRAKITSGTCTTAYSAVKTIIVNPTSVGGTATGGGVICSGGGGTLKLTGYTGTIQWLSSTNGLTYNAVASAKAASLIVTGLTQNTWYKAQVTSGSCASTFSNPIKFEIGSTATVGSVSAEVTSICKGTGTTLQLGTGNYGSILWEKSTNGGTTWTSALGKTTTLSTGALSATSWFRATTYIGTSATVNCAVAHSEPIVISVIAAPLSKGITGNTLAGTNNGSSLLKALTCNDDRKVLSVIAGYNGAIQWQWSTISNVLGFNNLAGATEATYAISSLSRAAGANYYRAKFTNSCGVFVYSNPITVYYKDCSPVAKIMSSVIAKIPFDVVVYPNPSSSNFNLDITTSSAENVEVKVYDVLGRLIDEQNTKEPTLKIGANYQSGTYILKVSQGENQKILQMIKK